jgi:hypothetical protein
MQITIDILPHLEQALTQTNQSPQELILQLLAQNLIPSTALSSPPTTALNFPTDPLFQLAGSISSELTDVAENHDDYIGQALYDEMHCDE